MVNRSHLIPSQGVVTRCRVFHTRTKLHETNLGFLGTEKPVLHVSRLVESFLHN